MYKALGLHGEEAELVNTSYLEAYNAIWNYRAKNRSPDLDLRTRLQTDLAPAFWWHGRFSHVVPSFNQAVIDGEVALTMINPDLALRGTHEAAGYDATRGVVSVFREAAPETTGVIIRQPASSADIVSS